jgi:Spy/CpxP family protein refolding chaperone
MKQLALWMIMLAAPLMAQMAGQMPGRMPGQMPRGTFNWWETPLARDINLSEDQRKQIQDTIRGFRPKLIDMRANLEKAELDTEDVLNDDTLDQKRANESIERLVTARGDMTRMMSQMSVKLRAILTTDQWKQLQRKRHEMGQGQGMRQGMGPMNQDGRMNRRQGAGPNGPPPGSGVGGPPPAPQAKPPAPEE